MFRTGELLSTNGASDELQKARMTPWMLLMRHVRGDFGDIGHDDVAANQDAIVNGGRIFSAYDLPTGNTVWVITEADRSATTFLLPDEY